LFAIFNNGGLEGGPQVFIILPHFSLIFHPSRFYIVKPLRWCEEKIGLIIYEVIDPYYNQNNFMMGVSGLAGDPAYPSKPALMPPLPLGKSATALAKGFNKLGWHWWPSDSAITTEAYDGRDKCINLGASSTGCAQGAKASTDITYWPHAIRAGVEVRTHCRVRKITMNDKGMATGVIYFDENDLEQHQAAEMVVLACNGIGTPRLLLNSKSNHFPDGLANNSGLVGKNLMFHPYGLAQGVFKEPLDGLKGP
jgi:Choline dehydrogenase and related flavoproteins